MGANKYFQFFFGNLLNNDLEKWRKIKYVLYPEVCKELGHKEEEYPDKNWEGWDLIAEKAGLIQVVDEIFGGINFDFGCIGEFFDIDEDDDIRTCGKMKLSAEASGKAPSNSSDVSLSVDINSEEEDDDEDEDEELGRDLKSLEGQGKIPFHDLDIEVVGKKVKKRKRGKQDILYQVHFIGYSDSEDEDIAPAKLRKEHPKGKTAIDDFEKRREEEQQAQRRKGSKPSKGMSRSKSMLLASKLNGRVSSERPRAEAKEEEAESIETQPTPEPQRVSMDRRAGRRPDAGDGGFFAILDDVGPNDEVVDKVVQHQRRKSSLRKKPRPSGQGVEVLSPGRRRSSLFSPNPLQREEPGLTMSDFDLNGATVEDLDVEKQGWLTIKLSDGRSLSSEDAHAIPELRLQLLELYRNKIVAFNQIRFMFR